MSRTDLVAESVRLRQEAMKIRADMGKVLHDLIDQRAAAQRAAQLRESSPDPRGEVSIRAAEGRRPRGSDF